MNNSSPEDQFKWAVQALALPVEQQLALFPSFTEPADELALDHQEAQTTFLNSQTTLLTSEQKLAINALDHQLERMSGGEHSPTLWTMEALGNRPEWQTVRALAQSLLNAMGWPEVAPPMERGAIYTKTLSDT